MEELLPLHETLGNYKILRVIGQGGMGVIYEARHQLIERQVAIKILHEHYSKNDIVAQRFFHEAKAINKIKHENIIDVFDYGFSEDGEPYFVMEYLEGRDLASELRLGEPFHYQRAFSIAKQILYALDASHKTGIIHRDLKPENIFLIERGAEKDFVKLLDFGVAKSHHMESTTKVGSLLGTPVYMSPEQIEGSEEIDHRADLYSLGVILFELFTGHLPYGSESSLLIFTKKLTEAPPSMLELNPLLPRGLEVVVFRALERSPEGRFSDAKEFLQALTALEEDANQTTKFSLNDRQYLTTQLVEPRAPSRPTPPRSNAAWVVAGVSSFCAVGALAFLLLRPAPAPSLQPTPASAPQSAPLVAAPIKSEPSSASIPASQPAKKKPSKPLFGKKKR